MHVETVSLVSVFNRVCGKMSGSSLELDRCGQQGFGESPGSSPRGLGSASLPTASTDSLTADTSEEHLLIQTDLCPQIST